MKINCYYYCNNYVVIADVFVYNVWQQADVLVNPVASKDPDLTKAGAVPSQFYQVAGSNLQQA